MNLYEMLKARKVGWSNDFLTNIYARAFNGGKVTEHEYTGAVPYTFTANGEPLMDWYIKGNTTQSGTPTPQNPVDVLGTGDMSGNLFDRAGEISSYFIDSSGAISPISSGVWFVSDFTPVQPNTTYTFTYNSLPGTGGHHAFYDENKELISVIQMATYTFTTPNNTKYMRFSYRDDSYDIMLNAGSTALPYEPYGYKIPILLSGTTTPVYLGEVQTERKIKKLVFDGTENWRLFANQGRNAFYANIVDGIGTDVNSSHFKKSGSQDYPEYGTVVYNGSSNKNMIFRMLDDTTITTAAAFKQWVAEQYAAGTPVTVWYVLAESETGIVNEPLMKIGDYADSLTAEQAGVEIATVNGSNTIDVDTTVKPSEVYIKYKGV